MVTLIKNSRNKQINFLIKREKAKEFIEESNKNVISEQLIDKCKEASKIFRKK
jgi:hypothetical protein